MHHSTFMNLVFVIISTCGLFCFSSAEAVVRIHIDLSTQRMDVESDSGSYSWPVSAARSGYVTPRGWFAPESLQRMHYSHKYHMSPMPYSIFFAHGYAIHGTYETGYLGRPASHGCIRLSPEHAAALFHMVQAEGARISISGSPPRTPIYASGSERRRHVRTTAVGHHTSDGFFGLFFGPAQQNSTAPSRWQPNPSW